MQPAETLKTTLSGVRAYVGQIERQVTQKAADAGERVTLGFKRARTVARESLEIQDQLKDAWKALMVRIHSGFAPLRQMDELRNQLARVQQRLSRLERQVPGAKQTGPGRKATRRGKRPADRRRTPASTSPRSGQP